MKALRFNKEFTNKELERIKTMYLAGATSFDIAAATNRTRDGVMAAIHRMIRSKQIPVVRSMALICLGGLDQAQNALQKATQNGSKNVRYLTAKCKYSNITVEALQQQISRYKLASHLLGATQ